MNVSDYTFKLHRHPSKGFVINETIRAKKDDLSKLIADHVDNVMTSYGETKYRVRIIVDNITHSEK